MAAHPERHPDGQTIEHRRRRDYSASTPTRVRTPTREPTDGHREWDRRRRHHPGPNSLVFVRHGGSRRRSDQPEARICRTDTEERQRSDSLIAVPGQKPASNGTRRAHDTVGVTPLQCEFPRTVAGLDDDAARREFVGSGTTPLWLPKHLARAELLWVLRRFAGTVTDPDRADRLGITIQGRGVFRRFNDTLARWPAELDRLYAFSDDRQRGRARAWLADQGYRPDWVKRSSGSAVRFPTRVIAVSPDMLCSFGLGTECPPVMT